MRELIAILDWVGQHWWIVTGAGAALAIVITQLVGMWVRGYEGKKAKAADQKKAAHDLLHASDNFRRYWAKRHFDFINQQPGHPEDEPGWTLGAFEPLVRDTVLEAIYSRLSPALQHDVFKLDQDIKDIKIEIDGLIEWNPESLEDEGPIRDAGIAIEADKLFLRIAAEAGMPVAEGEQIQWIQSWLVKAHEKKRKQIEAHQKFTKELFDKHQQAADGKES
jgi:hypothetical protein